MFPGLFTSQSTGSSFPDRNVQEAFVSDVVRQGEKWRVSFEGTYWNAHSVIAGAVLRPNDRVYVVGRRNIDLLIQPVA